MAPRVLAALGGGLGWELGALWELDGDSLVARSHWRARHLSTSALEAESAPLPRGRGIPQRVWDRGELAWRDDVASDPEFLRAASAQADGFRAAVFVPLVASGRLLGVVELFSREAVAQDREIVDGLSLIGRAIGLYLERVQSRSELEAALRALDAELQNRQSKLAREIHDILGQELTGLKLDAAWVVRRLSVHPIDPPALVERLEAMSRSIDGVLATVRRIATDLRAGMLDDLGLAPAIESLARELAERSGLQIELDLDAGALDAAPAIDRAVATALYRGLQELLTNIVRHAGARRATISLREAGGSLELRVRDDGAGIDSAAAQDPTSLGLRGIRERALAYGGSFAIAAGAGGTEAVLRLPRIPPEEPR